MNADVDAIAAAQRLVVFEGELGPLNDAESEFFLSPRPTSLALLGSPRAIRSWHPLAAWARRSSSRSRCCSGEKTAA